MTREKEDELLGKLRDMRRESGKLIQKIVDARKSGDRDDAAIAELAQLSKAQAALTRPVSDKVPA